MDLQLCTLVLDFLIEQKGENYEKTINRSRRRRIHHCQLG